MLSGILNSDKATNMNIAIMRAFVEVRRVLLRLNDLKEQMKDVKERLGKHDAQLNQIYGYDMEATLAKHPIKELGNESHKTQLLESLQRGNRQSVTLEKNDKEQKAFIEASPQFKSLNFYDNNMQRIKAENLNEKKRLKSPKRKVQNRN